MFNAGVNTNFVAGFAIALTLLTMLLTGAGLLFGCVVVFNGFLGGRDTPTAIREMTLQKSLTFSFLIVMHLLLAAIGFHYLDRLERGVSGTGLPTHETAYVIVLLAYFILTTSILFKWGLPTTYSRGLVLALMLFAGALLVFLILRWIVAPLFGIGHWF